MRIYLDFSRASEIEPGSNAFQAGTSGRFFDAELQTTVAGFHPNVQQEGHEPVPSQGIVVERQDASQSGRIIGARRKVGA